jgi:hypothetical protein
MAGFQVHGTAHALPANHDKAPMPLGRKLCEVTPWFTFAPKLISARISHYYFCSRKQYFLVNPACNVYFCYRMMQIATSRLADVLRAESASGRAKKKGSEKSEPF